VEFPARELHTSMPRTMLQSYADQT
jgi:hypothetical protein